MKPYIDMASTLTGEFLSPVLILLVISLGVRYDSITIFHSYDTGMCRDRSRGLYPSSGTGTHLELN